MTPSSHTVGVKRINGSQRTIKGKESFMRHYGCFLIIAAGLLVPAGPASADKKWQGQILHMPVLGDNFAGAKVLLGSITGRCSREFGDLLRQDLLAHGVTVVSDKELTAAASDHHLQVSLPLSGGSAELGRVLGPTDLISTDISRCQALPREPIIGSGLPAMHISRTEGHFQASLRVVDLATGDDVATLSLRADPGKQNESQTGSPEYPAASELVDIATRQAIEQTRHLYTHWSENQELVFMDDKECNLRQSWDLLKAGDYSGLLRAARTNAESCHAGPKIAAAAWYDLALADMLLQNYEGALAALDKSQKLHDIREAADMIDQCKRNKSFAEALARQVVAWTREEQKNAKPVGEVQTGIIFDNDLVVRLVQGNVADEDIVKMIASQPTRFALNPEDLAKMRDAGVPEAIVNAMLARK
jgi:hypothetical protein